ncbi:MAG: M28 family peptidase [Vicinamibacterales bacterium]
MTSVAKAGSRRRFLFPVRVRVALISTVLLWNFGLTALEKRRMESSATVAASAPAAPLVASSTLLSDVKLLSDPSLEGRLTGSQGNHRAQALILERFKQIGLEPVGGWFEQKFSFTRHSIRGLLTPGRAYRTEFPDATNLAGAVRGSSQPDSWTIVTAHYDHLGIREGELYPGADDNASGVSTLLATARYFAAHRPAQSILFVTFDAEEQGLKGSSYFVEHSPIDLSRVALVVNLDMVSRGDAGVIVASGTRGDAALQALVRGAATSRGLSVQFGHDRPWYLGGRVEDWSGSSDHGPFLEAGVRALYYGVEDHDDYHRPGDTADRIPPAFFAEAASLVIDTVRAIDGQR